MGAISTYVMLILLHIINLCLHSLALFLLIYIRKRGRKYCQQRQRASQQLFLINFSASNALKNLILILLNSAAVRLVSARNEDLLSYLELHGMLFYLTYINSTGIYYLYISSIIYLAMDRILTIFVSMKYPLIWSRKKTLILLASTWAFSFISCVVVSVLLRSFSIRELYRHNLIVILRGYVHVALDLIFVVIAISAYMSILLKYLRLRKRAKQKDPIVCREYFHIFINTNSYISIFLITTSITLFFVPNLMASFTEVLGIPASQVSPTMTLYISMSQVIADTVSGFANIFLQKPVRKLLYSFLPMGVSSSLCQNATQQRSQQKIHVPEASTKPEPFDKKNTDETSYAQSNTTVTSIMTHSPLLTTDLSQRGDSTTSSSSSSSSNSDSSSSSQESAVRRNTSSEKRRRSSPPFQPPPSPPSSSTTTTADAKPLHVKIDSTPSTHLSYTISRDRGVNAQVYPSAPFESSSSSSSSCTSESESSSCTCSSSSCSTSKNSTMTYYSKKRPRYSPPSLPPPTPPTSPPPEYSE